MPRQLSLSAGDSEGYPTKSIDKARSTSPGRLGKPLG